MFASFTAPDGKSIRIDTSIVLAVEELESGCRVHVGASVITVRESLDAVMAEIANAEDMDDDEDEDDDED